MIRIGHVRVVDMTSLLSEQLNKSHYQSGHLHQSLQCTVVLAPYKLTNVTRLSMNDKIVGRLLRVLSQLCAARFQQCIILNILEFDSLKCVFRQPLGSSLVTTLDSFSCCCFRHR